MLDRMRSATAPDCTTRYSQRVTSQLRPSRELLERVLGEDLLALRIEHLTLDENLTAATSRVTLQATETASGARYAIQGEGVGLIDALFRALVDRFAPEYRSLSSLHFTSFSIRARRDADGNSTGSDAIGEVTLELCSANGNLFRFDASGRSIASAATQAVVAGVEYFVNAERAFIALCKVTREAEERGRDDLVARYTRELTEVVQCTNYAELVGTIGNRGD
jgi:hypothetical protein